MELIDLRSIRPLDEETVLASVEKTGRLIVADTSCQMCGVASEVAALVAEKGFSYLQSPVKRITLADSPAPVSLSLEKAFYQTGSTLVQRPCPCWELIQQQLFPLMERIPSQGHIILSRVQVPGIMG